uniref:Uncharacterized protein n=1 Tax=candidate division WOR-3 bacterium TaxID=2052148 RepID=A0A7V3ZWA0_UNCW3
MELKISMMTEQEKKEKKKKEGIKVTVKYDFIPELIGRPVAIEVDGKDEPIAGMIVDNSTFWIKLQDVNGRIMYLNKAYLKAIIPLKRE